MSSIECAYFTASVTQYRNPFMYIAEMKSFVELAYLFAVSGCLVTRFCFGISAGNIAVD